MLKLFNFFLDLCLLRRAPQDLPASPQLLVMVIIIAVSIGAVGIADVIPGIGALAAAMLDAVIVVLLLRLALQLKNVAARFTQTATAVFGSSIILGLIALPMQLAIGDAQSNPSLGAMISLAYLFLLLWVQLVIGHILRHALNVSLPLGIGLALVYSLLSGSLIQSLFLEQATAVTE